MVGEISPDGNFIWNGVEWVPKDSFSVDVPNAGENLGNSAQVEIQTTNWNDETLNCTINYVDQDLDGLISSGDYVSIDCEEDALNGFEIGIANEYGISVTVDMEVPWASPILTIIALLGAALLVSRRD